MMRSRTSGTRTALTLSAAAAVTVGTVAAITAGAAAAAPASAGHARGGGSASAKTVVRTFPGSASLSKPDDITRLGDRIYVGFQNGVGSNGEPSPTGNLDSTVQEYTLSGHPLRHWSLKGKCDGLTADPERGVVIATVNEDSNSSLYTIDPDAGTHQVRHYSYSPSPLAHGGGTDSISIAGDRILIAASNPSAATGPAVYQVRLSGTAAKVRQVFADDATAVVANTSAADRRQPVTLALTDPDSTEIVPSASPRFRGDFLLTSQGDAEQIYVDDAAGSGQKLSVLRLSNMVNDTAWATARHGTLYVTQNSANNVVAISGRFEPGTAFVAVTPATGSNFLGTLDLRTGVISPFGPGGIVPEGLLFVPSGRR
jgi:hypothetical protein